MREIWLAEAVAVVFLALPVFRPFAKALKPLDGLDWLPLIALLLIVGIFPAYGFRPECLPLLVVALCMNAAHFLLRRKEETYRRPSPLPAVLSLVILVAAAVPVFAFPPKVLQARGHAAPRILRAGTPGGDYSLRVYETVPADAAASAVAPAVAKPLIFLVPPEIGSAASVDLVCRELLENGFTVVTYSREGRNASRRGTVALKDTASPFAMLRRWRIYRRAAELHTANEAGKALEAERRLDIEYLLPLLPALLDKFGEVSPLLLAGYSAGGSALAYMAGESRLGSLYNNALGVVAIESRLWSSYLEEERSASEIPEGGGRIRHLRYTAENRLQDMKPRRVIREGTLPASGLPVLYLVSGRALDTDKGQQPYQAVFDTLRQSSGPVALAAVESAGPLDYQDYPLTRPVYSFLLPGKKGAEKSESPVSDTAAIIGNFAVFLLEQAREAEAEKFRAMVSSETALEFAGEGAEVEEGAGEEPDAPPPIRYTPPLPPARQPANASLHFESKGMPGFQP